jgi:hypothetical protein
MTATDMKGSSSGSKAAVAANTMILSTCSPDSLVAEDISAISMVNDADLIWKCELVFH